MRYPIVRRANAGVLLVIALAVAGYAWTVATSWQASHIPAREQTYPRLADSFLHGQLSVRQKVPPGLLRLRDPYDPVANAPFRVKYGVHDLTLYHGKLYSYWGPLPALALMPIQAVGLHLNQAWLVLAFCIGVLLVSALILRDLLDLAAVRRRRWMDVAAVAALAFSGVVMFNLRRPAQYELALSAGVFFVVLGALFVVRAVRGAPQGRSLTLASACFGCAVLCRPSLLFTGGLLLVPLLRDGTGGWRERAVAVAARWRVFVPFLAGMALFGLYNLARFGSPLEFGTSHQLGGIVFSEHPYGSLSYLPPGLWYYLFHPPLLRLHFPYVVLPPPPLFWGPTPTAYDQLDLVAGMAVCTPVIWLLLAFPWARRSKPFVWVVAAFTAISAVLLLFDAYYVWVAEMRYEMELLALLLIAALAVWVVAGSGRALRERIVRWVGAVLIAVGIFFGLALSINGQDPSLAGESLQSTHPATFRRLARFFSPIPSAAAVIAGHPLITALNGHSVYRPRYDELAISRPSFLLGDTPMIVEVVSPSTRTVTVSGTVSRGPVFPPGGSAAMTVSIQGRDVGVVPVTDSNRFSVRVPVNHGINDVKLSLGVVPHPANVGDHFSDVSDLKVS